MRGYRWEPENVVALKVTNSESQTGCSLRNIEELIAQTDTSHRGHALFRTNLETFEVCGPEGRHLCFAYEPMREPMWIFQRRSKHGLISLPLIKTYIRFLLTGLDYLHTSCRIVHTDPKLDNIMVSFEDPAVLSDFMDVQPHEPMQCKTDSSGRPVYRCHNNSGLSQDLTLQDHRGVHPTQPDHYRAPEVILGCGWNTSTDIWNLGVLLWDLVQGNELFRQVHDPQGHYAANAHLAEMIGLLRTPPLELVARSQSMSDYKWPEPIRREDGEICASPREYFGGPFFDKDGHFLHESLIHQRNLADTLPFMDERERQGFLSFVETMLAWLPEERKTAGELADHPFLRINEIEHAISIHLAEEAGGHGRTISRLISPALMSGTEHQYVC